MKDLAPDIFRQRLLIEGFYTSGITPEVIEKYFETITGSLDLRMYGKPTIFSTEDAGESAVNQGYDAFAPLLDSGISVYVWSKKNFLSIILYTCKGFDKNQAVEITKNFFKITELEHQAF